MPEILPQKDQKTGSSTGVERAVLMHGAAVFLILLIVYLATMPLTVALEDDGLFILSSFELGISHPPGYPLHTIIGHLFSKIPIGSVAARVHTVSAVFGALTCMLVFLLINRLIASRSMAYLGALSYGLSLWFWSQSLIAEVYSLNTFFFFLLFYLCIRFMDGKGARPDVHKRTWLIGSPGWLLESIALIYGLSLTNHWPLMVLSTPALLVLLWPKRIEVLRAFGTCFALAIIGLTPYLWMYLHSQTDPYISLYGPMEDLSDLWFYISRQGYSSVDRQISADLGDKWHYLGFFFRESMAQYGVVAFGLSCIGVWVQFRYLRKEIAIAFILAFLGNGVLLVLLLGFNYEPLSQRVFRVYPLIAYGVMGVWLSVGLYWLTDYLYRRALIRVSELKVRNIFAILIVALVFTKNLSANNRHSYIWAEEYAKFILENLDRDAVLFVTGDVPVGTVGYMNRVKKIRPDITLYNQFGFLLGNRLYAPLRDSKETGEQAIAAFIKEGERSVYAVKWVGSGFGYKSFLFYREIEQTIPSGSVEISLSKANLNFLITLINQKQQKDPWTEMYRIFLLEAIVPEISAVLANSDPGQVADTLKQVLDESLGCFNCKLARIKWLMDQSDERYSTEISQLLDEAEKDLDGALKKSNVAELYQQKARWYRRRGMLGAAFEFYQKSIDSWFHPKNQSVNEALKLYKLHGRRGKFDRLVERIKARL